jgi:L-lysine 2,3-aminomutase
MYFIIHCNHPQELDPEVIASLRSLSALGIQLLNQSVLLKGVNDDEKTFLHLCESLVNAGVIPYYLHQLDPVKGTGHFFVSEERGHALIRYVQEHLSGYGVPRFVKEIAGQPSKTFL